MESHQRKREVIEEKPGYVLLSLPEGTTRAEAETLKENMWKRLLEAGREMVRKGNSGMQELEVPRKRSHFEVEKKLNLRGNVNKRKRCHCRRRKLHHGQNIDWNKESKVDSVSFLGSSENELSQHIIPLSDNFDNAKETVPEMENSKINRSDYRRRELNEASNLTEEEGEASENISTEEKEADTEESTRRSTNTKGFGCRWSQVTSIGLSSLSDSETSPNKTLVAKPEDQETKIKKMDEPIISLIDDEFPKSEKVLQDSLPPYFPSIQGCRSVEEFEFLNKIEEGAFGVVYRAQDKRTNEVVALKMFKRFKEVEEKVGFPISSLREINVLFKIRHQNIVTIREVVVSSNIDKVFTVMEYVEHDLRSLMKIIKQKNQRFIPGEVKCLMVQLLQAVAHLHDNFILHRDLKTSNLLLSHRGILKVGDFGLAREYGSPPLKYYTPIITTLWYRAPEILLRSNEYSTPVDMWSVGCIFGEFLSMEALFPGESEVDQLNRIFKDLGTPREEIWRGYNELPAVQKTRFRNYPMNQLRKRFATMLTEVGMDLMKKFLTYDPAQRVTAENALCHAYFSETPLPIDPSLFPKWSVESELSHQKSAATNAKPPPGSHKFMQLGNDKESPPGSFHMDLVGNERAALGSSFTLKFDLVK